MTKSKIKKIYLIVIAIYVALVTSFYFIAGEQLWYTESSEKIKMLEADGITDELNKQTRISQTFTSTIDKIDQIELVFTKGYQEGFGKVTIVFINLISNRVSI